MMKFLAALTFTVSIFADTYKAPKMDQIHWKKVKKAVHTNESWANDVMIEEKAPDSADPATEKSLRKPSSGESEKPKFWDFKVVK